MTTTALSPTSRMDLISSETALMIDALGIRFKPLPTIGTLGHPTTRPFRRSRDGGVGSAADAGLDQIVNLTI